MNLDQIQAKYTELEEINNKLFNNCKIIYKNKNKTLLERLKAFKQASKIKDMYYSYIPSNTMPLCTKSMENWEPARHEKINFYDYLLDYLYDPYNFTSETWNEMVKKENYSPWTYEKSIKYYEEMFENDYIGCIWNW